MLLCRQQEIKKAWQVSASTRTMVALLEKTTAVEHDIPYLRLGIHCAESCETAGARWQRNNGDYSNVLFDMDILPPGGF